MLNALVIGTIMKFRNITTLSILLAVQITVLFILTSVLLIGLLHPLHAQIGNTSSTSMTFHILKGGTSKSGELIPSYSRLYNLDRKSTRLNSSHMSISYAVFCL